MVPELAMAYTIVILSLEVPKMAQLRVSLEANPDRRTLFLVTPEDETIPPVQVRTEAQLNRLKRYLPQTLLSMAEAAGDELSVKIDETFFR
jgi:hypothetical protein